LQRAEVAERETGR